MIDLAEIRALSDFQRNAKSHIRRLKRSGKAQVLTVNGKAEVVVQDARAYQRLLAALDEAETVAGIRRGLESVQRKRGVSLADFDRRVRRKHGIPRAQ